MCSYPSASARELLDPTATAANNDAGALLADLVSYPAASRARSAGVLSRKNGFSSKATRSGVTFQTATFAKTTPPKGSQASPPECSSRS